MILPEILQAAAQHYRACPAILDDEGSFTWPEFADRVARVASVLKAHGLRTGERFGVIMLNGFRTAELFQAGYWTGCPPVPVNWRLAPAEIAAILEDAGCRTLVVDAAFAPLLEEPVLAGFAAETLFFGAGAGGGPFPDIEAALAGAEPVPPHPAHEDDDALILYTGGTTGRSKGVRLTHRNIVANAQQNGLALGLRYGDVWLHAAPMFHSGDLLGNACSLLGGGHVYLRRYSGAAVLEAIERHRVTATVLPPTMLRMAMDDPSFPDRDLGSLRLLYYGSAPMPVEWIRDAMEKFPHAALCQGYGQTETAPILTVLDDRSHREALATGRMERLRSAGRPVPEVWIRIVDDAMRDVPPGSDGEVAVRGPNVMAGYHALPEETAAVMRDGWLLTGDLGRMDEEGCLYLFDRKKDMVVTGGENVYTTEVEAVLHAHPAVQEAAVIGVPDPRMGEALFAVIVPRPGAALDEAALIAHCRGHIGGYKIPRRYAFVDAMPRNAMGKTLKTELRKIYGG